MIDKNISLKNYILYTLASILLYWFLISFWVNNTDSFISLVTHTICAFISLLFYSFVLLRNSKWVIIICSIFILKIIIGLWHYLYFIDPAYFTNPFQMRMHEEYQVYYNTICIFADAKKNDLFTKPPNIFLVSHPDILNIISFIFYRCGNYLLTIMPLNAMVSLFAAVSIAYISRNTIIKTSQITMIVVLCALFPINLIASIFQRDMTGQFLMTVGVVLIVLSKNKWKLLFLLLASYLFYLQRTPYIIIPFAAYLLYIILRKNENRIYTIFIMSFVFIIIAISYNLLSDIYEKNGSYLTSFSNKNTVYLFPVKFAIGIIGPFPWTQFVKSYESSYQLQDYLMAVFLFSVLYYIFPYIIKQIKKHNLDFMILVSFCLIIFGIMNPFMHISYVSIGVIFLMPVLSKLVTLKKFLITFMKFFSLFLIANFIYILAGLQNSGFSTIFK
jgi:hypothetical protein